MDKLTAIRRPVEQELTAYKELFDAALAHEDDFLGQALDYVRRRQGKMMRPLLVVLMAKELGKVSVNSLRSAVTLELLHTASLVHIGTADECVCVEQIERFHACSCLFCSQKYINTLVNTAFFVLLYPKSPLGLTS